MTARTMANEANAINRFIEILLGKDAGVNVAWKCRGHLRPLRWHHVRGELNAEGAIEYVTRGRNTSNLDDFSRDCNWIRYRNLRMFCEGDRLHHDAHFTRRDQRIRSLQCCMAAAVHRATGGNRLAGHWAIWAHACHRAARNTSRRRTEQAGSASNRWLGDQKCDCQDSGELGNPFHWMFRI